jgi:glycosyltransferase involved in cell wall biosynthesis
MERLLSNTGLAQSMGRNGQRLVEEHFTWGYVADEAVRMYNQVIRGAARHAVLA